MPIYDYVCTACDHRTDILHGINEPGPHYCPSCGREGTMRKQFAAPAVHYKGSGWAKKDRGSSSGGSRASSGPSAGHKADAGSQDGASGDKRDKGDQGDKGDQRDKGDKGDKGGASSASGKPAGGED
jgi:putative FmdB family regulatory protein